MVDSFNTSNIVVHPFAAPTCSMVICAETGFLPGEYNSFYQNVLVPIQNNALGGQNTQVATTFMKGGESWNIVYSSVSIQTVHYTAIAVVPVSE